MGKGGFIMWVLPEPYLSYYVQRELHCDILGKSKERYRSYQIQLKGGIRNRFAYSTQNIPSFIC